MQRDEQIFELIKASLGFVSNSLDIKTWEVKMCLMSTSL